MEEEGGLLPFVPVATRAMLGLSNEQEVLDAAMGALSQSPCETAILRVCERIVSVSSVSMGESMTRAIEAFVGPADVLNATTLDAVPTIRRIVDNHLTLSVPIPNLCKELLPEHVAGKVASLLGGAQSSCVGAPIRLSGQVVGVLLAVQHRAHPNNLAATTQLAESISMALSFAQVLTAVKRARTELSADHPAQHYLGAALLDIGQLAPNAPRSLAPGGGVFDSIRPRMDRDSFSLVPEPDVDNEVGSAPRARILLVEDEERVRKSTIALLGGLGYAVEGTESGERAIALYTTAKDRRRPFDLVLLDQTLIGQIGGVETLRILRSLDPSVRAIMLSGQAVRESHSDMERHGFSATINKPVTLEVLNAAIESALA